MSQITVPTSLNIELEFNVAPFHKRLLAWLIDVAIFFCYWKIMNFIFLPFVKKIDVDGTANTYWFALIIILPITFYPLVCEYTMKGQTIGKKLMRIKIINETGGNATLSQYMLRWLIRVGDNYLVALIYIFMILGPIGFIFIFFFGFVGLLIFVDFLCMLINKKGQRMGDIAAGTILINTKTENVLHQTVFMEVEETYTVRYPEVMKLSDRDMNTIKNIHTNLLKNYDSYLAANTAAKIKSVLKIISNEEPIYFIETVLKDYNYLSTR